MSDESNANIPLGFDSIRKNAEKQGISLESIAIIYRNLAENEIEEMRKAGILTDNGSGTTIAHFLRDGSALFPNKATSVLYLGAD